MARPIEVTTVPDFRREVERSSEPTLVMFTTTWCPFCRRFKPKFVDAVAKSDVRSVIAYIDDWGNPLWGGDKVDVGPTPRPFANGEPGDRRDGGLGRGAAGQGPEDAI